MAGDTIELPEWRRRARKKLRAVTGRQNKKYVAATNQKETEETCI
ncbi:hypothetical protein ABIC76_005000 [Ralstonia sp. 1138]